MRTNMDQAPAIFAAVRVTRIPNIAALRHAEAHGRRADDASIIRVADASKTAQNLATSAYSPADPLALVEAFKAFKSETGAVEGGGKAAIGLHVLCIVSPDLIAEAGDVHDPENPTNRNLFLVAQDWASRTFGDGSLIAARMDMDEAGSGVVDLFVCPTAMQSGGRRKKEKLTISVNSALKRLQGEHGNGRSFRALQTSWAAYAAGRINPRIRRGISRVETQRQHIHADIYRTVAQTIAAEERHRLLIEQERQIADAKRRIEQRTIAAIAMGIREYIAGRIVVSTDRTSMRLVGVDDSDTHDSILDALRPIREALLAILSRVQDLLDRLPEAEAKNVRKTLATDWDLGNDPAVE